MPELIEVEYSRRLAEDLVGRRVATVELIDPHASAMSQASLEAALVGTVFGVPRRRGKLLLLDVESCTLGIHFGMTGRLVLDGRPAVERLLYAPVSLEPGWLRFRLGCRDGATLELHDARRLARVFLDPAEAALGPDAASVTLAQLRDVLHGRRNALKARLLDQAALAGVGNLIADEVLWRTGLSPSRPAGSLNQQELSRLHRRLHSTIALLLERGGSHTGDLMAARGRGGMCPLDGAPLDRTKVGGRTTYSCPLHQR